MRLSSWRIVQDRHAAAAFSGEGARLYGGRWNSPGTAIVYTAQSRALAALEMLVHLDKPGLLLSYLLFEVSFDAKLVRELSPNELPANWQADPVPKSAQNVGDRWVNSGASAVLRVPSVLIPGEFNFLLNPLSQQFADLQIGPSTRFEFDPRLTGGR